MTQPQDLLDTVEELSHIRNKLTFLTDIFISDNPDAAMPDICKNGISGFIYIMIDLADDIDEIKKSLEVWHAKSIDTN